MVFFPQGGNDSRIRWGQGFDSIFDHRDVIGIYALRNDIILGCFRHRNDFVGKQLGGQAGHPFPDRRCKKRLWLKHAMAGIDNPVNAGKPCGDSGR